VTTATALSGSNDHVWEVAGVLANACERRERGDVSSDEARRRSGLPVGVSVRAGVTRRRGHVLARAMPRSPWQRVGTSMIRGVRSTSRTR
jgi:hypothetical protein